MAKVKICEELKNKIINDFKAGLKQKSLCDKYSINKSVVSKIIKKFRETGSVKTHHLGGRPRKDYSPVKKLNSHNNSIEYDDEYTYTQRHSVQLSDIEVHETLIPDETPYENEPALDEQMARSSVGAGVGGVQPSVLFQPSPPSLRPSNTRLLEQTLYTLQNQMEHQTKLLEHLSQISSTMASLMESQVHAVEKQTEAMRRQATATEHRTLVMNNFVDMIRDKMPKQN